MVEWDVVLLAVALEEEEQNNINKIKNRKRKLWVDDLWKKRCIFGQFHTLHNDLRFKVQKFHDYHRMDIEKFQNLVTLLRPHIGKQNTKFRSSISTEERLSICLR